MKLINKKFFDTITVPGVYGAFGLPGSGKTTGDAGIAAENLRRRIAYYSQPVKKREKYRDKNPFFDRVYCTDETVQNCIHISYEELGKFKPPEYSLFILSEAGLGLNNRNWKNLEKDMLHFMKLIRHNKCSIWWESQTADIDKSLRVLTSSMWYIESSIGNSSIFRPISYEFGVDNDSGELRDCYHTPEGLREKLSSLLRQETWWLHRKRFYKFFDSYVDNYDYVKKRPPAGSICPNFAQLLTNSSCKSSATNLHKNTAKNKKEEKALKPRIFP